jgi:hypothetical protein
VKAPVYPHGPIQSVGSLCRALFIAEALLCSIAERVPKLYIGPTPKPKKSGNGFRDVYDTRPPLKPLLKRINKGFFERVVFPDYLHGSIRGCDFISNARVHEGSVTVITEDIKGFFDHITEEHAYAIWRRFFGFGEAPSELLTKLVTNGGRIYQGAPTSSYLANLVFWDIEPRIVEALGIRGLRYSRFVDDVTMSHPAAIGTEEKTWAIAQVYAMLGSHGFKPARQKHAIFNGSASRTIMRVNVNELVTITPAERRQVRAMVHQIEQRVRSGENTPEVRQLLSSAIGKIGRIQRLHPGYADKLRLQAHGIQSILDERPIGTEPPALSNASQADEGDPPF